MLTDRLTFVGWSTLLGCPFPGCRGGSHRNGATYPSSALVTKRFGVLRQCGRRSSGFLPSLTVMAIARFPSLVIDCPDPVALATFYGALLDWPVTTLDYGAGAQIRADYGDSIGFQRVEKYTPPQWPGQEVPQQMHVDVVVDDLDAAEAAVIELGATKHEHQPGTTFRVFLDPAGHPFCLCLT